MKVQIVDGGFSAQLYKYVDKIDGDPLWTARHLIENPDKVIQTHLDSMNAGATVITTNTYQASIDGFKLHAGLDRNDGRQIIKNAVKYAQEARELFKSEANKDILIAGSCGSYGGFLCNGSEYTGSFESKVDHTFLKEWHRSRVEALLEAGVDLLAFETIPCSKEAKSILELMKDYPQSKFWLSFSCKDYNCISNGESFKEVVQKCSEESSCQLVAIGINCTNPIYIESLITAVNNFGVPLLINANSGEMFENGQWVLHSKDHLIENYIKKWLDLGVQWIGGCCRVDCDKLRQIKGEIDEWISLRNSSNRTKPGSDS